MNQTVPADWSTYLRGWFDAHAELDTNIGLTRHGWKLIYTDTHPAAFRANEREAGVADSSYSIGLTVADTGTVRSVA